MGQTGLVSVLESSWYSFCGDIKLNDVEPMYPNEEYY